MDNFFHACFSVQLSFLEVHLVCLLHNIDLSGVPVHWQTYGPLNLTLFVISFIDLLLIYLRSSLSTSLCIVAKSLL